MQIRKRCLTEGGTEVWLHFLLLPALTRNSFSLSAILFFCGWKVVVWWCLRGAFLITMHPNPSQFWRIPELLELSNQTTTTVMWPSHMTSKMVLFPVFKRVGRSFNLLRKNVFFFSFCTKSTFKHVYKLQSFIILVVKFIYRLRVGEEAPVTIFSIEITIKQIKEGMYSVVK